MIIIGDDNFDLSPLHVSNVYGITIQHNFNGQSLFDHILVLYANIYVNLLIANIGKTGNLQLILIDTRNKIPMVLSLSVIHFWSGDSNGMNNYSYDILNIRVV